jgi:hypothetical protein
MGTADEIAAWQERAGIRPPTGRGRALGLLSQSCGVPRTGAFVTFVVPGSNNITAHKHSNLAFVFGAFKNVARKPNIDFLTGDHAFVRTHSEFDDYGTEGLTLELGHPFFDCAPRTSCENCGNGNEQS